MLIEDGMGMCGIHAGILIKTEAAVTLFFGDFFEVMFSAYFQSKDFFVT